MPEYHGTSNPRRSTVNTIKDVFGAAIRNRAYPGRDYNEGRGSWPVATVRSTMELTERALEENRLRGTGTIHQKPGTPASIQRLVECRDYYPFGPLRAFNELRFEAKGLSQLRQVSCCKFGRSLLERQRSLCFPQSPIE
jgi:hypothetical protein